jgi:predicted enzyme related to lactoylglutathione lyase
MIKGIDVVFIHAKNPDLMVKWYEEKLGLKIGFSTPDKGWQEFELDDKRSVTRFALDYCGADPSPIEKQPIIISFKVEYIEIAVKKLEKKGVEFIGKNKITDVGSSLIATFQDPEGNYLQLSQRKNVCS